MTEHEAILKLKDIAKKFSPASDEELEQMFYDEVTLNEMFESVRLFNQTMGKINQILSEVESER